MESIGTDIVSAVYFSGLTQDYLYSVTHQHRHRSYRSHNVSSMLYADGAVLEAKNEKKEPSEIVSCNSEVRTTPWLTSNGNKA